MLKRIIAVLLILAALLSFAACDNSNENNTNSQISQVESEVSEFSSILENPDKESTSTPLFWRATDADGDVIWLLGSIHTGLEEYYPLPESIMTAYHGADALAVELNIITAQQDYSGMAEALRHLVYTDGTKISDHIPSELYTKAKTILESAELYMAIYDMYEPAMWMSLISNIESMKAGLNTNIGVDMCFLEEAMHSGKTVIEIESMNFQYEMLGGFSPKVQEMLLEQTVTAYEDGSSIEALKGLANAWGEGNEDYITSLLDAGDVSEMDEYEKEYYEAMYTNRNKNMTEFCIDALEKGEEVFVVVGLAHFLGEDGIVNLLRQEGYEVERVK